METTDMRGAGLSDPRAVLHGAFHQERVDATLVQAVAQAWRAFDRANEPNGPLSDVPSSAPILFFGDLNAYRGSPLRVLTVGLNPSWQEFPAEDPFRRFPLLAEDPGRKREPRRYLDAMSAYFCTDPYRRWFSSFEPLLNGLGASYYAGTASTALHTDICSPVATNPTWSQLSKAHPAVCTALETDGGPLWHLLLEALRPQIVTLSVARRHIDRIRFPPTTERWKAIHTFERTGNGATRSRRYEVRARWYGVDRERSLFVFGPAAQTPFGLLADAQKREAGAVTLEAYQAGLRSVLHDRTCSTVACPRRGART